MEYESTSTDLNEVGKGRPGTDRGIRPSLGLLQMRGKHLTTSIVASIPNGRVSVLADLRVGSQNAMFCKMIGLL